VLEQWVPLVVCVALVLVLPVGVVGDRRATDGARLGERLLGVEDEDGLRAGYGPESSVNLVPVSQEEEERGAQSGLEEGVQKQRRGQSQALSLQSEERLTAAVLSMIALAFHVAVVRRRNVLDVVPVRR
jgi:hypothetical protein